MSMTHLATRGLQIHRHFQSIRCLLSQSMKWPEMTPGLKNWVVSKPRPFVGMIGERYLYL